MLSHFQDVPEWTKAIVAHVSTTGHVELASADNILVQHAGVVCLNCRQSWTIPVKVISRESNLSPYMREVAAKRAFLSALIQLGIQDRALKRVEIEEKDTVWDRLRKDDDF